MDNLFSTHPDPGRRIAELQKMAGEMGATSRPRNAGPWDASPGHTPGPWG